jgi:acetolactate synthase-1/2/3 large subunit
MSAGRSPTRKTDSHTRGRELTTAEATVESLIAHGIDTVFGLPGLHNDPLFDAFHGARDRLRVVHTRHEQGAGYMALGAALVSGQPQAFAVVPGPGLLNAGAALLTAEGMIAPVLALVGQIPEADIDRGHGHLHEIRDQLGLAAHIAKHTARIKGPGEAAKQVAEAIRAARSGRPGPAVLECAVDVWSRKAEVSFPQVPLPVPRPPVDEEAVDRAARILGKAKRPIIIVGGGALDAGAEVQQLAEMLEAPVVAYRRGQGVLSARHRLSISLPIAYRLWKEADAAIGIGTRMFIQQAEWGVDDDLAVVRIDIDPQEPARYRKPAVALVGDAADYCRALIGRIPAYNIKRADRTDEIAGHRAWLARRLSRLEPQASFVKAIRNALPEDGVFVDEVTQVGFASRIAFPVYRPRTYLSPGYQDNLGWGYGAALGAKIAKPDVPVVSISGDGGFLFQATELATAVRHGIAVVAVVFDNGLYGNVRLIQNHEFGGRTIASDLFNPDFRKLAESFDVAAFKATSAEELERTLEKALALNAPALIHVPCGEMPSPWDLIIMPRVRGKGPGPTAGGAK